MGPAASRRGGARPRADLASIGAAVIGTGFIGTVHVEPRRSARPSVAFSAATPNVARQAADALGVPVAYSSLDDLLADDRVLVVHVTSPNDLHISQSQAALKAGKHVMCEKPLAMSADESAELVALAAETGLVNAVNFNIRYYPSTSTRTLVADGAAGQVTPGDRPLLPGLAAPRHRLELAPPAGSGRQPARCR